MACIHAQEATRLAGYHSLTSWESPEIQYDSEEWYSESPLRKSLSPATKKRHHEQFEADIAASSSHCSDPEVWAPVGKTPEEIAAWCAEYERGNRRDCHAPSPGKCRYISCTH